MVSYAQQDLSAAIGPGRIDESRLRSPECPNGLTTTTKPHRDPHEAGHRSAACEWLTTSILRCHRNSRSRRRGMRPDNTLPQHDQRPRNSGQGSEVVRRTHATPATRNVQVRIAKPLNLEGRWRQRTSRSIRCSAPDKPFSAPCSGRTVNRCRRQRYQRAYAQSWRRSPVLRADCNAV
jgi:hypothetical protein